MINRFIRPGTICELLRSCNVPNAADADLYRWTLTYAFYESLLKKQPRSGAYRSGVVAMSFVGRFSGQLLFQGIGSFGVSFGRWFRVGLHGFLDRFSKVGIGFKDQDLLDLLHKDSKGDLAVK